jgi:hypothetical protein
MISGCYDTRTVVITQTENACASGIFGVHGWSAGETTLVSSIAIGIRRKHLYAHEHTFVARARTDKSLSRPEG